MSERNDYLKMLEIPVSTCTITYKPVKKKRSKTARKKKEIMPLLEEPKNELINKINMESDMPENSMQLENGQSILDKQNVAIESDDFTVQSEQGYNKNFGEENIDGLEGQDQTVTLHKAAKSSGRLKFGIVAAQLSVICILIATIFLTNVLWEDSGINVFFKNVFSSSQTESVDERSYYDFSPVVQTFSNATVDNGVINVVEKGSLYSPCDGVVSALTQTENGKYTIEISHSDNFKTLFTGVDYAYVSLDEKVYFNLPFGYSLGESVKVCFLDEDSAAITDYTITDGVVVWQV